MRSMRTYIKDSFPNSTQSTPMDTVARSVIVAAVISATAPLDLVSDLQATANRILGMPVLFTENALLLGSESTATSRTEGTAHVVELPIHQWDSIRGGHQIDLLNAPTSDESVVLVRACGDSM